MASQTRELRHGDASRRTPPPTHLEGRMELEEFADRPFFNTSSSGIHLCGHGVTFSTHVAEERITSPARLLLQLVEDGPVFFL